MNRGLQRIIHSAICLGIILLPSDVVRAEPSDVSKAVREYEERLKEQGAVLDSIRKELSRGREKVKELKETEGSYLKQIQQFEQNIETSEDLITKIALQMDTVSENIESSRDSLYTANEDLEDRSRKMKKRIRNMYKTGKIGKLQILFGSRNTSDLIHRMKYFVELNRYDRMLLESIQSTRNEIRRHTATLELERDRLALLKTEREEEQEELLAEQESRKNMLETVRSEREAYESMVAELERAQEELNTLLKTLADRRKEAKLEQERGRTIAFEKRKGKLPWPVYGTIDREFGKIVHPVYKTVTMNMGIDIRADRGEDVMCVAPGRVDYVGWMRGYGRFAIVNHAGYVTVYAHLDSIAVAKDQDVEYGTILGRVGESGSLDGSKLHFQIRRESDPVNPREWLERKE